MNHAYNHITIADTFDRLHSGHESLIDTAFSVSKKVSIGLSTTSLLKNKSFSNSILSYDTRKKALVEYLTQKKYLDRTTIFELNDICGIAKYDATLEAVVVTLETYSNAKKINLYRKKHKLNRLDIIKIPYLKGNDNKIIRSTRIRKGEIDRKGFTYSQLFSKANLRMPEELREDLKKPIGFLITGNEDNKDMVAKEAVEYLHKLKPVSVITVGDIVSNTIRDNGLIPDIQIVDFKTQRNIAVVNNIPVTFKNKYINKPGKVHKKATSRLLSVIKRAVEAKNKHIIIIKGEEDLLALPAILFAPLNSAVIYGLFNTGLVIVTVTEEKKTEIKKIIDLFY